MRLLRHLWFIALLAAVLAVLAVIWWPGSSSARQSIYAYGPVGKVYLTQPEGNPQGMAMLVSGRSGWTLQEDRLARDLSNIGIIVAGVDARLLVQRSAKASVRQKFSCLNFSSQLHAVGKDVQHRLNLDHYIQPVLLGVGEGGALAYIAQAQSGNGFYQAAMSIGLPKSVDMPMRGCGKTTARTAGPDGYMLAALPKADQPWFVVLDGGGDPMSDFVRKVGGGKLIGPRQIAGTLMPVLQDAEADDMPGGLPITEIPATAAGNPRLMAILYSGDGGWAGLDRDIAAELARRGIPVAGMSSLKYFWTARTPQQSATDLQTMMDYYSQKWGRSEILLVGYSFGADVLPFIYDALPPERRKQIIRVGLIGFSDNADFQFHLDNWLVAKDAASRPTLPEVARMAGSVRCIGCLKDRDNACPRITNPTVRTVALPGDHHLNDDAGRIVDSLLER